nr:hypothetical protein [Paracoccus mutanolyticus]
MLDCIRTSEATSDRLLAMRMVHLAQQQLGAVAGLAHLLFGAGLGMFQPAAFDRQLDAAEQQVDEIPRRRLPDVVHRPHLQRVDRNRGFGRAGHIDHRRARRAVFGCAQEIQPGRGAQMMVQHDDAELGLIQRGQRRLDRHGMGQPIAAPPARLFDQPHQHRVVVDVKDVNGTVGHDQGVCGTCMTEKNSPSCRIAWAKPS